MSNLHQAPLGGLVSPAGPIDAMSTLAWTWQIEEKVARLKAGETMDHPAVLRTAGPIGGVHDKELGSTRQCTRAEF